MENYYEILEIDLDARPEQIRRAFRDLAKKYHPDVRQHHPDVSRMDRREIEEHFRKIRDAYDTLIDPETRKAYNHKLRIVLEQSHNSYPEILRQRKDDPQSQAKLVLHYLLNEKYEEAIEVYETQIRKNPTFDLNRFLDDKDGRDCEFLLGEAYENRGNWRRALNFYEAVYQKEQEVPLRFFFQEVKDRIRDIYCKRIARKCAPVESIEIYEKVMEMSFNKKTEAYLHKKIAEAYYKDRNLERAEYHLRIAFQLEPKLKGAQKICEKLGIPYRERSEVRRITTGVSGD